MGQEMGDLGQEMGELGQEMGEVGQEMVGEAILELSYEGSLTKKT